MAFLNIFKKKPSSVSQSETTAGKEETKKEIKKRKSVFALSLPHISEKAAVLGAHNQYVFKVMPRATKHGVKASVEEHYGVLVKKVAMIKVPAKSIRVGKGMGEKPGYKKAVVTLKEGHTIETVSS